MRLIAFLGPSMPWSEAPALCPAVELKPPARRGDFDDLGAGDVVGLIDGVFGQNLAVSPSEIRAALGRGATVLGGSSMGALRASEVPGVEGVGTIYEMFRDGRIERDDEVALAFNPETFAPVSEPLVNIRWAAESLARAGTIGKDTARRIVEAATGLHFTERSYRNVLRAAGIADRSDADPLIALLRGRNLKRDDAQSVLERMKAIRAEGPARAAAGARSPAAAKEAARPEAAPEATAAGGILVWEYGDRLEVGELIDFLKLSNALGPHAERLVARSEEVARSVADVQPEEDAFQARFGEIQACWGWQGPEETSVTLADLGVDLDALAVLLQADETVAARTRSVLGRADDLRTELLLRIFTDELALKRAALRLGALLTFAARGRRAGGALEPAEIDGAKRVVCAWHQALDWSYVAERCALPAERLASWVERIAYARRDGQRLARIVAGYRAPRPVRKPTRSPFERRLKLAGDRRFCTPFDVANEAVTRIASAIGVTRIGSIGELDELGAYVFQAFGQSNWSASMGTGKSDSREGARVGAVMEEVETFSQDQFEPEARVASYLELAASGAAVVDPTTLALPYDSRYRHDAAMPWIQAHDLVKGERVWCPAAICTRRRLPDDPLYSARAGRKVFGTNGLAAGFTLEEAILHALCELVERHAERLASLKLDNPGRCGVRDYPLLDLASAPASVQARVARLAKAGWSVAARDLRTEVRVPTFHARIFRLQDFVGLEENFADGWACHPDAEVALRMAILEAVQIRLTNIAGAREDLTIHARSLGRHERPRPLVPEEVEWYARPPNPVRFDSIRTFESNDVAEEIEWVVRKLVRAGFERVLFFDLTNDRARPARAVRVVVPGLEDINPFFTGLRARAAAGADFLT
jgi:ribosomal protein S12 methylthiotransferase accessory factor